MNEMSKVSKKSYVESVYLNMGIFLLGKLVSLFGTRIMNFAISLHVLKLTGSGMSFAITMIVSTLPAIVISPFAGVLADRVNRKLVVVLTDALSGLLLIGVYFLSLSMGLSLSLILVMVFLLSILNTFFNITMEAAIPNIVDQERLRMINSYSSSINSLASIVGPALGGFIYGLYNVESFLLIAGISFIISAISEVFINFNFNKLDEVEREKERIWREIKSALDYVKTKKIIYSILTFAIFINFAFSSFMVTLPHIINVQLGLTAEQYGLIQSAFAIASLIFSIIYSILPEGDNNYSFLIFSLMATSVLIILTGLPTLKTFNFLSQKGLLIYFMIINFLIGGALIFLNLPTFILIQKETSDEYRGRVNGLLGTSSMSIQPLGMALGGFFIDHLSSFLLVLVCGIMFFTISLIFIRSDDLKEHF